MTSPRNSATEPDPPSPLTNPTKRIGFTEFLSTENSTFKRRVGTLPWLLVSVNAADNVPPITDPDFARPDWFTLFLVRFHQFPEEPLHWSLVISPTDDPGPSPVPYVSSFENHVLRRTFIFEVRGDPEQMFHNEIKERRHVSLLENIHSIYELAKFGVQGEDTFEIIKKTTKGTECPKARTRKEVNENCQGWCVRVVDGLAEKGIVGIEKVQMMKDMLEAVNLVC
jgi:hypothetical protein